MENLLSAWREFLRGKRKRKDVAEFSLNLTGNILALHRELANKTYRHGSYPEVRDKAANVQAPAVKSIRRNNSFIPWALAPRKYA